MNKGETKAVTIVGAGLAGGLMTVLLARRGIPVHLMERRPDPRNQHLLAGRSINLALADRGLHALKVAGLYDAVQPLLIPMSGRILHDINGRTQLLPYGQGEHEVIYSVSRNDLTQLLLDQAQRFPHVSIQFDTECNGIDFNQRQVRLTRHRIVETLAYEHLVAADGVSSVVRDALLSAIQMHVSDDLLPHGYKELTLPADTQGHHQLHRNALHIWPRGGFMLIALPNVDGTFTVTLFLPFESVTSPSFASLRDKTSINTFFTEHFPDVTDLMPKLAEEFLEHPVGRMHTLRCPRWGDDHNAVLIGDAAHAIVPFHGQGMNCAFEDCIELDALLRSDSFTNAVIQFEKQRKLNTNAIADMALENYIEMRDTVRQPGFVLQKELSFELERRFPDRFIPRYSMVMFHHAIPYAVAYERGNIQARILDELTRHAATMSEVDMALAAKRIHELLSPLATRSSP